MKEAPSYHKSQPSSHLLFSYEGREYEGGRELKVSHSAGLRFAHGFDEIDPSGLSSPRALSPSVA